MKKQNKYKYMYKRPNFFQRNFSFAGRIDLPHFGSELGIRLITFLCAAILICIAASLVLPLDSDGVIRFMDLAVPILAAVWAVPIVALSRRRLRDAGCSARTYLWLLLPVVGWILFLIKLCRKSV